MTRFGAVVTTGIYCRPGCPGRPSPGNVQGFPLAASAEAAGFRACQRCRPYRQQPSAIGLGPELVCRAVRLIIDGVLDEGTEHDLGARLGISARQLRRLFGEHLGLTPDQLACSCRAHFARRLLDDTDLSFTEVAFAAGFGSVRQFNRSCLMIFRATPTELRARRRVKDRLAVDGGLALRLPFEHPLDWDAMLGSFADHVIGGVEAVCSGSYRRTVLIDGDLGVLDLSYGGPDHLVLRAHLPHWQGLLHVVRRARRIFHLDADVEAANCHLGRDPLIGALVRARPGIRPPGAWDPFEAGISVIVSEQASRCDAAQMMRGIVRRHGTPVPGLGPLGLTHLFPAPSQLASADLRGLGLGRSRIIEIRAFARAVADSGVSLDRVDRLDALMKSVVATRGISAEAARYLAVRLGEPDAFPGACPWLQRCLSCAAGRAVTPAEAEQAADGWRPWRAYAAAHLWLSGPGHPDGEVSPAVGAPGRARVEENACQVLAPHRKRQVAHLTARA